MTRDGYINYGDNILHPQCERLLDIPIGLWKPRTPSPAIGASHSCAACELDLSIFLFIKGSVNTRS